MGTDGQAATALLITPRADRDRKLIQSTLSKVGFTVIPLESGNEISEHLRRAGEHLGLVVADPETPGLDFPHLLKTLDELDSPARVLCICEETEAAVPFSGHAERLGGTLKRPFRRAHLVASILDASEKPLARTA